MQDLTPSSPRLSIPVDKVSLKQTDELWSAERAIPDIPSKAPFLQIDRSSQLLKERAARNIILMKREKIGRPIRRTLNSFFSLQEAFPKMDDCGLRESYETTTVSSICRSSKSGLPHPLRPEPLYTVWSTV